MPPWVGALGLAGGLLQSLQNGLKTGHSGALGGGGGAWGIPQPQPFKQCSSGWGHSDSRVEKGGVSVSDSPCLNGAEELVGTSLQLIGSDFSWLTPRCDALPAAVLTEPCHGPQPQLLLLLLLPQIMYHVGVTALLRKLGIINSRVKFAGASGGSVAAAYSCARDTLGVQKAFRGAAGTLAANCRPTVLNPLANNCKFTLDSAVKSYLFAALPGGVVTDCTNRLFVAVTNATTNREAVPDTRRFVTVSAQNTRLNVSEALAASSYIPRFSGVSAVTRPSSPIFGGSTIPVVYDGVATDPLPVPPGEWGALSRQCARMTAFCSDNNRLPPCLAALLLPQSVECTPTAGLSMFCTAVKSSAHGTA